MLYVTILPPHPHLQCWWGLSAKTLTKRSVYFASALQQRFDNIEIGGEGGRAYYRRNNFCEERFFSLATDRAWPRAPVCLNAYVHVRVSVCAFAYACVRVRICAFVCVCIRVWMRMCMCVCMTLCLAHSRGLHSWCIYSRLQCAYLHACAGACKTRLIH